ncbi:MAG: tRNA 5-methoxyuridine(34)/uridine 5-oxyacetic acid(34) synthase CmoB [Gammaproteobacteria bacterium]|nr:tRNA 5-methoxyuridine(34)/uridine 5-oxyacetic acid(34) synthase CmoB [Gammaproteobacteria bacterium]
MSAETWDIDGFPFAEHLLTRLQAVEAKGHGDLDKWRSALAGLPMVPNAQHQFTPMLKVSGDVSEALSVQLKEALLPMHPWRKGPFQLFDQFIDTEWRSDWKWERVLPHLSPLAGRKVLDVGCGNGYYMWRMAGEGATQVLGVDPMWLFRMQYRVLSHYFSEALTAEQSVEMLPLGVDDLPENTHYFDTVFSMGVLYHRRDPVAHIRQLLAQLRSGGELVLETLVIPEGGEPELWPEDRYAQMRNVHALPTVSRLLSWVEQAGGVAARCVDEADTTTEEQRQSPWMWFYSLPQYLDPKTPCLTVEGLPGPRRAVIVAKTN